MNAHRSCLLALAVPLLLGSVPCQPADARPNFVVIFVDDLGYADIGPFGATKQRTPNLDRMANEGMRLSSFYVSCPFCSPSRAALMTGCYHVRTGVNKVLFPGDAVGLAPGEVTVAEVLKSRGYRTACIGKWHLGDQAEFLPTEQGFDSFFGLPYSNDMWPAHDGTELGKRKHARRNYSPLPLLRDTDVARTLDDQASLVAEYTDEALRFVTRNRDRPFFLYLPHTAVHLPLYPGKEFRGRSQNGPYGDWIEEVDWSTGRILDKLVEIEIDDRTLVLFTSDNGPSGNAAGSAAPLRGKKGSVFEGGVRVPAIAWWPGRIPAASTCDEVATTMDVLPTFAALSGATRPQDRTIDGKDITALLEGRPDARSPHDAFYYFKGPNLLAVRSGRWKLHRPARQGGRPRLFDLETDVGEQDDVAAQNASVVERLQALLAQAARDIGGRARPIGRVENPRLLTEPRAAPRDDHPPNFVIIFTDDQGYNDAGCYGSPLIRTPNIDRMAAEGIRFTSFYAQVVCGPSRAAIMTGCYPMRVGEPHNRKHAHTVLHPRELTIAEVLKTRGYRTACVGKWHLAGNGRGKPGGTGPFDEELMPNAQGFDRFYGTPMHNGTTLVPRPERYTTELHQDGEVIESPADMDLLTKRYTEQAIAFVRENRDRPFFLYLAHTMPHIPLGASPAFKGKSERGLYGDAIEEVDWSVGRILETLRELEIDDETLVVFTSDNGPWIEDFIGDHAGSADPLRGWKMSTWEGGCRVPGIAWWPGRIEGGRESSAIASTLDLLPTFAGLAGAELSTDRTLDGVDLWPLLSGATPRGPRDEFYYYAYTHLQAVRQGRWKLVLPRPARPRWTSWYGRMIDAVDEHELYDLDADIAEQHDVAGDHPDVVARLRELAARVRKELGDYDVVGTGQRFWDAGDPRPNRDNWRGARKRPDTPARNVAHPPPVGSMHFDFESGELAPWHVVEGSFDQLVTHRVGLPNWADAFGKQGQWLLFTGNRRGRAPGDDSMVGVVESPVFVLQGDVVSLLVGGGSGAQTYVALCALDGRELVKSPGNDSPTMRRVTWDVRAWRGRQVVVRVVDRKRREWGHVTLDDLSVEGAIDEAATQARRKR